MLSKKNELEQREFGKYDRLLAERDNVDLMTIRNRRAGFQGTGTVHDVINARSGQYGTVSGEFGAYTDLSDFGKKTRKGVDRGVRNVNAEQLEQYKEKKQASRGDSKKAFEKLEKSNETSMNAAKEYEWRDNSQAQANRRWGNSKHELNVKPEPKVTQDAVKATSENVIKDTAKTAAQESTQKAAPAMNQVNKNGSGMLQKGMQWASKHKVGLGVAAGTAAVAGGGAYLYNRAKKKKEQDNNQ